MFPVAVMIPVVMPVVMTHLHTYRADRYANSRSIRGSGHQAKGDNGS